MTAAISASRRHRLGPRFAARAVDQGRRCDTFLVVAIAAVLGNRVFLVITGYPQLGNGTLHISHAIWGAFMMATAIVLAISFLGPFTRSVVAVLGGAGFGWFIDELGKFITREVNYFFQPTIALIYITFVAMYLVFRSIQARAFGPDEAVLNGLEALKSASIGNLDDTRRRSAIALIEETGAEGAIPAQITAMLRNVPALPPRSPGRFARFGEAVRARYTSFAQRRSFARIVSSFLVVLAVASVVTAVSLAFDHSEIRGVAEWATVVSSLVSGLFYVIGAVLLGRSRLEAYIWFDRGLLVEILVTQVFQFQQEQLAGVIGLIITVGIWVMVRSAITAERERESLEAMGAGGADVSAAPAEQSVS
jgi:hypothetical protein